MKSFFKFIGILILLFIAGGLILPSHYSLQREITINAKPAQIHHFVGDLNEWPIWSPWKKQDASIIVTVKQPTGVGAHQSWVGDTGKGSLTFTFSSPEAGIKYDMVFDDQNPAEAAMRYEVMGEKTKVTWSMQGNIGMPVVGNYFALMMDTFVGPMFEMGLKDLKKATESAK